MFIVLAIIVPPSSTTPIELLPLRLDILKLLVSSVPSTIKLQYSPEMELIVALFPDLIQKAFALLTFKELIVTSE